MSGPLTADDDGYEVWNAALEAGAASKGPVLVLGGVDVGKTTFTRLVVNRAIADGKAVAVLDADPGQSEIGPPMCAGLAFADSPVTTLGALAPAALMFLGGISPVGHIPEHITAVRRLADLAGDRLLIVDTCGYMHGPGARTLIQSEFDLLAPAHVIALQRGDELHPILASMRKRDGCSIHTPGVPAVIARKPPSLRAQRRAMRFAAYFHGSQTAEFAFDTCAFVGTWLGGGTPVPAHILRFINSTVQSLGTVFYAETSGRHLGVMSNRPIAPQSPEMGIVLEQLKTREITVTVTPRLKHLVVGLEAATGKLLGLGLLASIDFKRRLLGVLTPVRSPEAACVLRFGTQRIQPDGSDAGSIGPREL